MSIVQTPKASFQKVVVFGHTFWLEDIETVLQWDARVDQVIKVMSIGMSPALFEAAEKHKNADAFIIRGRAIRNMLPLALQKLRTLTRAPTLVLMNEEMSVQKIHGLKAAGATEVLARSVITNREFVEAFMKMMNARPKLRLVK